ncbi:MAG TPA: PA2169 family four-helix-bundle protein [Polyangiaceae bacterium]|nr:PA2169 family four-helix-bundle protein [Polyangiaceae bacterium]
MSIPPTTDDDRPHEEALAAKLRALIKVCYDAEQGYRVAASAPCAPERRALFERYAEQRAECVAELRAELARLPAAGEAPASSPEPQGPRHTLAGDEHAAVACCARLEGDAIKAYEDVLGDRLPPHVEPILRRQYEAVKGAYDAMSHLRGDRSPTSRPPA